MSLNYVMYILEKNVKIVGLNFIVVVVVVLIVIILLEVLMESMILVVNCLEKE